MVIITNNWCYSHVVYVQRLFLTLSKIKYSTLEIYDLKNKMNKVFLIIYVTCICFFVISCVGKTPTTIGAFSNCPKKPNCVSTKDNSSKNYISPIKYKGSRDEAKTILLHVIDSISSSNIKSDQDDFIYVEFISEIFGFVDDVEFYFNKPGIIDFRSASRIGYSDLGVNRNRMEAIRKLFNDVPDTNS